MTRVLRSVQIVIDVPVDEDPDATIVKLDVALRSGGIVGYGLAHESARDEIVHPAEVDCVFAAGVPIYSFGVPIDPSLGWGSSSSIAPTGG
jgi:hypothetical protein